MSDKIPKYSPLAAFARKALLWVVLPVGLVVAALVGMATYKTPYDRFVARWSEDTKVKIDKSMEANRAMTDLQYQQAVNHPDAARLKAELSKLTPEERVKRVNELMNEFAKKARAGQQ